MNYYERHIGDYLKDTAHLSLLEHGVYGRLLDVYYTREGPLADVVQVARLIGARSPAEKAALKSVLAEFFDEGSDGWSHSRCDREISRFQDKQRKAKASADARWSHTDRNANAHANASPKAMRTHSEGNAPSLQTPDTRHQAPGNTGGAPKPEPDGNVGGTPAPDAGSAPAPSPRAARLPRPAGVDAQVWDDWLALRKAKRAPVTATVVDGAIAQAAKAGMTLDAFLRVWCRRGSQGLEADWLRPEERGSRAGTPHTTQADLDRINAEATRLVLGGQPQQEVLDA